MKDSFSGKEDSKRFIAISDLDLIAVTETHNNGF